MTTTATAYDSELAPLDRPLPRELTGSPRGWLTRYRSWPVFSAQWMRGRLRAFGVVLALLFGFALLAVPPDVGLNWIGPVLQIAVNVFMPLWLGPALALWVRRRGWAPGREFAGLVLAMLVTVAAIGVFNEGFSEPLKQQVAEWTGQVDAQGKRRKTAVMIGMSILSPESGASAPRPAQPPEQAAVAQAEASVVNRLLNLAGSSAITFALAGGFGLFGWRNERRGLAELRHARELAGAQAQRREAELKLSVLAAQVEPHFLFNTLAGVRSAIATDPTRAAVMIDRLVDYLRAAIPRLRSDGAVQATLGAQLDIVRAYLGLMAARMPRLGWRIDAPADLLAAPFPPLMLISLAENAVKHGCEPKIGPVQIVLRAWRDEQGRLEVSVEDDGAGFGDSAASGGGLGLANIRERLAQMFGERAELRLKSRPPPPGGVVATIVVPLETESS